MKRMRVLAGLVLIGLLATGCVSKGNPGASQDVTVTDGKNQETTDNDANSGIRMEPGVIYSDDNFEISAVAYNDYLESGYFCFNVENKSDRGYYVSWNDVAFDSYASANGVTISFLSNDIYLDPGETGELQLEAYHNRMLKFGAENFQELAVKFEFNNQSDGINYSTDMMRLPLVNTPAADHSLLNTRMHSAEFFSQFGETVVYTEDVNEELMDGVTYDTTVITEYECYGTTVKGLYSVITNHKDIPILVELEDMTIDGEKAHGNSYRGAIIVPGTSILMEDILDDMVYAYAGNPPEGSLVVLKGTFRIFDEDYNELGNKSIELKLQ